MSHFSLANLQAADGPQAAFEVKGNYYQLCELQPSLQGVSTRSLFATWDQSLPLLVRQAERVDAGDKDIRGTPPSAAQRSRFSPPPSRPAVGTCGDKRSGSFCRRR
jgi:hypothetical protein